MAELIRSPVPRGRIYYSSNGPIEALPQHPYFQPRRSRPHTLRVGQPRNLTDTCIYTSKRRSIKRLLHGTVKLANSRESVKKALRLSRLGPSLFDQARSLEIGQDQTSTTSSTRGSSISGSSDLRSPSPGGSSIMSHRPSLVEEVRSPTLSGHSTATSFEGEKPVASGNGVSVSIVLTEPFLFLQGFDPSDFEERNTTMLRGSLRIRVTKSAKIKTIYLKFRGKAETEWPEGKKKKNSFL
jgi:arrestin-related trafficking adapter 3/6